MNRFRSALSLIELLLVISLSLLILTPAYRIFLMSTETSMQGLHQIDLVLEARRVLRQVHDDLAAACFPTEQFGTRFQTELALSDFLVMIKPPPSSSENQTYSFLRFPAHGETDRVVSKNVPAGKANRLASRIKYILEPSSHRLFRLVREEIPHPALQGEHGPARKILTERLNYFDIEPEEFVIPSERHGHFFRVTLQLAHMKNTKEIPQTSRELLVSNRSHGILVADFFDIVCPETFSAMWNQPKMNHNWHTVIQGPR